MFLAIREIRHSKLRYALIAGMILLISYLIFVLSALAFGLAQSNRLAIDSWHAQHIVLNADADGGLRQSTLTQDQLDQVGDRLSNGTQDAQLGELSAVVKRSSSSGASNKATAEVLGIRSDDFIYQQLRITQGKTFTATASDPIEAVADESLKTDGYQLGDTLTVNGGDSKVRIVGFTSGAKLSVAPVLYVSLQAWHDLKYGTNLPQGVPGADIEASAVVLRDGGLKQSVDGTEQLAIDDFIQKLPGYSAQNATFDLMIGFLMVISLVIIAIFLYILTMQKIPNLTVLKIQGITSWYLVRNTVSQALLVTIVGVAVGAGLTALTAAVMPPAVPMDFDVGLLAGVGALLVLMAVLGSLAPVRTIVKIKPTALVSGE